MVDFFGLLSCVAALCNERNGGNLRTGPYCSVLLMGGTHFVEIESCRCINCFLEVM